jgi:multidrug efflux system membrane fusion protein
MSAIGNVEAYSTVSIKARVSGELMRVYFSEGQFVDKGDLLFSIDPQHYKTALDTAQANLAKDTALSRKADNDVVRYSGLFQEQLVSRDDYEKTLANAQALNASLEADRAAVENARLQLNYCSIFSPVSGRTGSLLADRGNIIKADDTPMVVINQMQPVYVAFSVPEKNLPEIKKYMASGKLRVEARISNENDPLAEGTLTFIDNEVNSATGTIRLKATFANKEKVLWPGQFVNVILVLAEQADVIVVPSQAVQTGQQRQFVFVIKGDSAELRPVRTGITYKDITVIEQGLGPEEQVVTDGQMRLMPGAKVQIKAGAGDPGPGVSK